jgi:hypothetical protein
MLMRVTVLTGAAAAAAQAGGAAASSADTNVSVTTTAAGSVVYGALTSDAGTAWTAEPGTTLTDDFHDTTHGEFYGTFRTTSATGTPGPVTVGAGGGNIFPGVAAQEILAAGTITEDPSAPALVTTTAATAVTSASFTPPPGSLLVVQVGCDGAGSGSAETCTVTDAGGGLTWTQMAHTTDPGSIYAGVWIADVPSGTPSRHPGWMRVRVPLLGDAPEADDGAYSR